MRFRGTTDEGETIEFKIYCKDSDNVIEYGSEIGVHQGIWHYVKKDTLECLEVQDLERQLEEAREEENKAFWSGFEIARMNPDFNDIQAHWGNHLRLKKHNEQLKEKG